MPLAPIHTLIYPNREKLEINKALKAQDIQHTQPGQFITKKGMASVSDFSSEGITVLDASADNDAFIQVDYFGQGVLVRVDLESRTLLGGHAYRTLRRTLGNAAHAFSHATRVSSPSDQDVAAAAAAAARRTIRRALAPLLHDCVAPGLAPDRDDRGRLNLAWCIYDGVQAFELAQDVEGNVYLAEAVVLMEEPPPPPPSEGGSQPRHGFTMARGRPVFMADRLALRVTSVSLRSITGTVTLATAPPQRGVRHTCLALRDVSAAGLRAASGAAAAGSPWRRRRTTTTTFACPRSWATLRTR
ncbi:hypothetical protein PWT90_11138 [Aphanocladium album]|nr:hypothetical protein PWT90_11138 [Aphanocladium album]